MADNIAIVTWNNSSKAYKALTDLRNGSWDFDVAQAAILERNVNGSIDVKDADNAVIGMGALGGGLLGMLVGVLGGPIGVLLGWSSGALFGSLADADVADDSGSILAAMSRAVLPGMTVLLLEVGETTPEALDKFVAKEGGTVVRRPADDVRAEIAAAQDAAESAAAEARRVIHEQKKQATKDKIEGKWNSLKDEFKKTFS
ncbi:DUF1269 domain-containing protein [Diaphorobacter aerolatus]|uniref:DUF1269 domain-containing protein n=1 Tax=Diaphorobacter aerolatus TaxID=1288495 RepID=A0A7H0GI09_9BURK|nr:DUF1269 domain-containing protein [Diaphorobacter aerolatus]QNP47925.1 DUF1269 domain-containing protein [Diaphorobacter aerolatus]